MRFLHFQAPSPEKFKSYAIAVPILLAVYLFLYPGGASAQSNIDIVLQPLSKGMLEASFRKTPDRQEDVQAVVLRIIDGDSLVVDIPTFPPLIGKAITIRLAGCDAPELKDPQPTIRALAVLAKSCMEEWASPGKQIWLRHLKRDKYFRILADVEVDGINLGQELISQGLARPYHGGKKLSW